MLRHAPALLAVALILNSAAASAQSSSQQLPIVAPGARVRLMLSADEARRTGHSLLSGSLVSGDSALVVIMRRNGSRADTVPTFTIDNVELYTGQRSRSRMIIGGTAAGLAASGLVYGIDRFSRQSRCKKHGECPPLLPSGAYAIPVALGAIFGATFSASRWVSVPRSAVYLGLRDARRLELSASVAVR